MKILYVTSTPLEYSSSANLRNIALITAFSELGHDVSILSAKPEVDSLYYDNTLLNVHLKNKYYIEIGNLHGAFTTKTHNTSLLVNGLKGKIKKLFNVLYTSVTIYDPRKSLLPKIKKINLNETYDIIISSSDPKSSHLLVEELIKTRPQICKYWIQYWGDPFVNDINKKTKLPRYFVKREENRMIGKSDRVVYVSPFTLKEQMELFPKHSRKMRFLPVPYKEKIIYPDVNNDIYTIGYFGDYYSNDRNILPLYNAINKSEYKLNVFGFSDIALRNTQKVSVNKRAQYNKVKKFEESSELLVCLCNKKGRQIPGKIYHYAATNKPILIILDGENTEELKQYFNSFERYILCENNETSIISAINSIKNDSKYYAPSEFFDPQRVAQLFLENIND